MASYAQINMIQKMARERGLKVPPYEELKAVSTQVIAALRTKFEAMPLATDDFVHPQVSPGYYYLDHQTYRVSRSKDGHLYASRCSGYQSDKFTLAKGLIFQIRPEHRITDRDPKS